MSGRAFRAVFPAIFLLSLCLASPAAADPRWWWDDLQVSTGGIVSDLDLDVVPAGIDGRPPAIYIAWLEWPDPSEGALMLTASYDGGLVFCPPVRLMGVQDPESQVSLAVDGWYNMFDGLDNVVQVLLAQSGRIHFVGGLVTDLFHTARSDECRLLDQMLQSFFWSGMLPEEGADAPDLVGEGGSFHGVWHRTAPGGEQGIRYTRGVYVEVPGEVTWGAAKNLPQVGDVSDAMGRPRVGMDREENLGVAFPDRARGAVLYLRSTDSGETFSATGEQTPSGPAVVNVPVPGRLAGPLALDTGWGSDWPGGGQSRPYRPHWHGLSWYQDLAVPVDIRFDAQFLREATVADPPWGPDLSVGAGGAGREEGLALSVLDGGGAGEPAPVFLFWTEPVGAATEILSRAGTLEADGALPIDLDAYPFPPTRPTDPALSTNLALTACAYEEATGGCLSSRAAGSARRAVSDEEEGDVFAAWIDDRSGTASVWFKRTDREVEPPEPVVQAFCPTPDTRAAAVSFRQLKPYRYDRDRNQMVPEKVIRYLVYYGRDPGGPYENTDRDGSDPGVPDTIFLTADAGLPDPAWADITGLETGATYYVIVVPEDEAHNLYPPDFDPLADRPDSPDNEAGYTTPVVCDSDCGPFVFGGPVTAVPGDCEVHLSWQAARGEPAVLYEVLRDGITVATGLPANGWIDGSAPWVFPWTWYEYTVRAQDGCAAPGPRTGESDTVLAHPGDFTPPQVDPPILDQIGPCTVRVDAAISDSCSGPGRARVYRDGLRRSDWVFLPHDDPVPGDGTYMYEVVGRDFAENETLSAQAQITVSGCTGSPRCLYRAVAWQSDPREVFLDTRPANDIAFAPPNDGPHGPCPFASGEADPDRVLWRWRHDLVFYQVEGSDIRDIRVEADRDPSVQSVRIFY